MARKMKSGEISAVWNQLAHNSVLDKKNEKIKLILKLLLNPTFSYS